MEIYNLKDLRNAFEKVPKEILESFVVVITETNELRIGCTDGEEEPEMFENFIKYIKAHPILKDIDMFFKKCGEEAKNFEDSDGYPIEYTTEKTFG